MNYARRGEYPWYLDKNDFQIEGKRLKIISMIGIEIGKGGIMVGPVFVKFYNINKRANSPLKFIALHHVKNTPFETLSELYPENNNFLFNDNQLGEELTNKISDQKIDEILQLLHRGGKIAFFDENKNTIVVEILGENDWDIHEIKDE